MKKIIHVTYKNGVLIPKVPLNLDENTDIEIILNDNLYDSFSIAGEDDNVEEYLHTQKEVVEND